MVWSALCIGALLGALAFGRWQSDALLLPAAVYLGTMIWFVVFHSRS